MAEPIVRGRAKDSVRLAIVFIIGAGLSLLLYLVVGAPKLEGLAKGDEGANGAVDGMGVISDFADQFYDRREELEGELHDIARVRRRLDADQERLRAWSRDIPRPVHELAALERARTPPAPDAVGPDDEPEPVVRHEPREALRAWFDTHFGILWQPGVELRDELRWQYDVDGISEIRISEAYRRGVPPLVREAHRRCFGGGWDDSEWLRQDADSFDVDACVSLASLGTAIFMEWRSSVERELNRLREELALQSKEIEGELKELEERSKTIYGAFYKESSLEALVRWSLPILAVVIMFVVLVGSAESESSRDGIGLRVMMRLLTVVLLIASILILGLSDKIDGEVLGALIGGISGYVLGRQDDEKRMEGRSAQNGDAPARMGSGAPSTVPSKAPAAPAASADEAQAAVPPPVTASTDEAQAAAPPPATASKTEAQAVVPPPAVSPPA